jgi:hypothetical protein
MWPQRSREQVPFSALFEMKTATIMNYPAASSGVSNHVSQSIRPQGAGNLPGEIQLSFDCFDLSVVSTAVV